MEVVSVLIIFVGIILLFRKKLKKSWTFVTGLSIVLIVASFCCGIVVYMYAGLMPTETVRIEATGYKNYMSNGATIGIQSVVVVDGREYSLAPAEGSWYYSSDDQAYLWLDESDKRWTESITKEITLEVPVGGGRRLEFMSGNKYGLVRVSYDGKSTVYDLYKYKGNPSKRIVIPDSDPVYDNFVKLGRLAGYNLMVLAILAVAVWLVKILDRETRNKLICGMLGLVSVLTFFLNVNLTTRSGKGLFWLCYDFNRSFSGNFVLGIILFPMLYKTFLYCGGIYRKKYSSVRGTLCIALPAAVFAIFMVLGAAFNNGSDTLKPIFDNEFQLLKSFFAVTGYFSVFFFGITWVFNCLDCMDIYKVTTKKHIKPVQMYLDSLRKRPFITTFVTLLLGYLPILIISYPGMIMADTTSSIRQIYGSLNYNNAHPIIYTLFLGLCMRTGDVLFKSSNVGVFIFTTLQLLFSIIVVSLLIKLLVEIKMSNKIIICLIVYYLFHPNIQHYFILLTKDVINAVFFLVFMISLYMLLMKKRSKFIYILLAISDLGVLLFRNDSFYVIVLSLMMIFFLARDFRKQTGVILICTIVFMGLWKGAMLPVILGEGSPSGSAINSAAESVQGDMFTAFRFIEVMQTARYMRDAGNEVTEEEKEIISAYMDYDRVVEGYRPYYTCNGVSGLRKSTAQDDLMKYHKIWLQMFAKHPEIYLEGILNFKYQYLYPYALRYEFSYSESVSQMSRINEYCAEGLKGELFHLENTANWRNQYELLRESFFKIPFFNILFTSGSFFWILLVWLSYLIYEKDVVSISLMMPLLCLIVSLILGPTNGSYFRYTYPYVYCLPFVIVLGLHCIKQRGQRDE